MTTFKEKSFDYSILIVGDEILDGRRVDRHVHFITRTLQPFGLRCRRAVVVRDEFEVMRTSIENALAETRLVITTGGLGPTVDDVTREALSAATGISLRENPAVVEMIEERFRRLGREMTPNNRRQALTPEQGGFYPNDNGTAPGLVFDDGERIAIALPGPPRELEPLVTAQLIPHLSERLRLENRFSSLSLKLCCIGESNVDAAAERVLGKVDDLKISLLAQLGTVELTLTLAGEKEECEKRLKQYEHGLRLALGKFIYADREIALQAALGELLAAAGQTLAVAESCTGGMLGSWITETPGSSDYFAGGVIAYSNEVKQRDLGVAESTLEQFGAVSRETAVEMAEGVRKRFGTNWGVSITGVAGPGGGSAEKPVGTVWIAAAGESGTYPFKLSLTGDRDAVRHRSCVYALDQVRRLLAGIEPHA
ncbi:MAG: competence/damage-inducible protein A [bacterium]|nr:competence/damage-inducible protein A [bacterium]